MPPICSMKADLGVAKKYYCPKKSHAKFAEFRKDYAENPKPNGLP